MYKRDMPDHTNGWKEEDFVESPSPIFRESDPWEDSPYYGEPTESQFRGQQPDDTVENVDAQTIVDDDSGSAWIDWFADESAEYDPDDNVSAGELEILKELVGGQPSSANWISDDYGGGLNELDRDEPEPQEEYDPNLSEPLYAPDNGVTDLSRKLEIDELVDRMSDADDTQRGRITELLSELSSGQLRRWLPWLRNQDWTGHSLLIFLEFRNLWDNNCQWWEWTYWDCDDISGPSRLGSDP